MIAGNIYHFQVDAIIYEDASMIRAAIKKEAEAAGAQWPALSEHTKLS